MHALTDLRQAARDRRDKLIAKARTEYEATLAKIASIEQDLLRRAPHDFKSIQSSVERIIPTDRPLTGAEIVGGMGSA